MRGRWFRKYEGSMDDPKVQMLSDWHYRAWDTLLCFASKSGGEFTDDIGVLSFVLRKPIPKVRGTMQVLLSAKLMEKTDNGYKPHNWDEFQYKSDTSNDRVKAFRERTRNVTPSPDCNVTETANETPPESDTETEQKQKDNPARKRASKPVVEPESFAEFWQAYPLSKARPDAAKAYSKALERGADPGALLAGARRYASEMRGEEKKFIKHAGGWIRDERWKDSETGQVIRPTAFTSPEEQEAQRLMREKAYGSA